MGATGDAETLRVSQLFWEVRQVTLPALSQSLSCEGLRLGWSPLNTSVSCGKQQRPQGVLLLGLLCVKPPNLQGGPPQASGRWSKAWAGMQLGSAPQRIAKPWP